MAALFWIAQATRIGLLPQAIPLLRGLTSALSRRTRPYDAMKSGVAVAQAVPADKACGSSPDFRSGIPHVEGVLRTTRGAGPAWALLCCQATSSGCLYNRQNAVEIRSNRAQYRHTRRNTAKNKASPIFWLALPSGFVHNFI